MMPGGNPRLGATDLDRNVLEIGLLTGLLSDRDETGARLTNEVALNLAWFSGPIEELGKIPSERTDQLFALLEEVFPEGGGFHLARRKGQADVLGLELRSAAAGGVVQPSLFLPLFDLTHQTLIVGRSGYPLELRVAVSAGDAPLIETRALRIGELSLSETIAFDKAPDLPDIVLSDVAWHPFGKDDRASEITLRELVDRASGDPAHSLAFLVDQLAAALSEPGTDNASAITALRNIVRVLSVGDFGLFRGVPFFAELAGNAALLKEWLAALQALLDGTDAAADAPAIQGSGTDADPFLLRVAAIGVTGSVSVTFARQDTGRLLAGVALESDVYTLASSIGVRMRGVVDMSSADLTFTLCHPNASGTGPRPLFQYMPMHWIEGAPQSRFSIGAAQFGIRVRPQEGEPAKWLQASLALENVERPGDAGAGTYDYDLLTLTRRPSAGGATADAKDAVAKLLADLASALPAVYQASQPAEDTPMPEVIGATFDRSAYRHLIDATRGLTGAQTEGIDGVVQSITGLAAWLAAGDLQNRSFQWLKARVQDGGIFGATGRLLALFNSAFTAEETRLLFQPTIGLSVSVGKSGDSGLEFRVEPRVDAGAVGLSLGAGVVVDVSGGSLPSFRFNASTGLTDEAIRPLLNAGVDLRPQLDLALALALNASPAASVTFYPIGDRAFAAALLPQPRLTYQSSGVDAVSWLLRLAPRVLLPLVEMGVLNRADVKEALEHPVLDFSLAKLLTRLELLRQPDGVYRLGDWSKFADLSAAKFLGAIVDSLQADEQQAQTDGVHFVALKNAAGTATDYGIRIRLTNLPLGGKDSGRTLQAGQWLSEETDDRNWLIASGGPAGKQPGAELILCRKQDGSLSFDAARIDLTSVGLDFEGKALPSGRKPLFDVNGYTLRKLKSRLYVSVSGGGAQFGGAIELNDMSMPLGPKAGGESGSENPVAANLLASGPDEGGRNEPVNPAFSALVAYRDGFYGKVFVSNGTPSADGKVWLPIGRSFGPLRCRQIGLGFKDGATLEVGYDGSVSLAALAIDLERLTIGIPLRDPGHFDEYELGLGGLNVSVATSAIQVSGGLSRIDVEGGAPRYDGMALIKAQDLTITGFGSYAMADGAPSLFVFAVLHKDLGGPAFFHVTGVAAGFGFNRALRLPPVEEVQAFPLVRAALDEHYLQSTPDALSTALSVLRDYIPPSRGDCWLAIGVRFSSFEMIQSFALLSVSFGHETEIGLLGMSTMSVPKGAEPGKAVAYAELALRAVIRPSEGLIAVEGRLTDKSYIFSSDCRLTGGFAFFSWFSGPHAGDFVVTIGGYHPRFIAPSHYPTVPRLGINWRVNGDLSITGEMYYALTPSCLMAGGRLCAVYQSGPIQAWFTAYADFLLNWQPFYYQVEIGILIGVACSVRINLLFCSFTLSIRVEIGVDLRLWGPPFAGEIYVNLSVISFTIRFGAGRSTPKPLAPGEFIGACLPPRAGGGLLRAGSDDASAADVISIRIAGGLIREQHIDDGGVTRIVRMVNAHELALTAQSIVPSTSFAGLKPDRIVDTTRFGIKPMGQTSLTSTLTVSLFKDGKEVTPTRQSGEPRLRTLAVTSGVPEALWGKSGAAGTVALPGAPEAKTIPATVGVRIVCAPPVPAHALAPIPLEKLKYDDLPSKPVSWRRLMEPRAIDAHGSRTIANTIWGNAEVDARRRAILDVVARVSPFELNQPRLEHLSASSDYFQADPAFALVESYGTPQESARA